MYSNCDKLGSQSNFFPARHSVFFFNPPHFNLDCSTIGGNRYGTLRYLLKSVGCIAERRIVLYLNVHSAHLYFKCPLSKGFEPASKQINRFVLLYLPELPHSHFTLKMLLKSYGTHYSSSCNRIH